MDDDLLLAIRLQEQYNQEAEERTWPPSQEVVEVATVNPPNKDYCIVDPSWELLDPSPDIHALFLQFNQMFFWGKLAGVEVKWSPRMTLCAGVCSYEGRGGLCSIRLSKPLLKFRPRKDLVQTLLHEMIHALLFVTHNNKDRDSHGPEFLKHMNRINGLTGSQISVYHSFHDEVEEYRKHWWRCNGPCQQRKPYYGYVKRAMNRAPSAHDPWWADHQRTCGGTYIKVKEPEPTQKDKKEKGEKEVPASQTKTVTKESGAVDIRTFMPFSGKGFKLGESSQSLQSKKVQNVIHPSPELPKPVPKNLNNGILNFTSSSASSPHRTENKGANTKMPKISVANTRMFISVGGSPVKVFNGRNGASLGNSSSSSTTMVQKRLSSETFASTNKVQKRIPSETSTSANMVNKRIPSETSTSANMVPKRTPSETFTSTNMVHKRNSSETSSFSKLVQKTSPSKMFTSTNAIQNRIPSDTFSSSNMVQKRTPSETFTSTNMVHKRNSSETSSSSNLVQKTSPSKMFTSSQRSPSASQGANRDGNYGQAAKRPRMDGSQGIKHFFHNVPVVSSSGSKPAIMVPRDQQRPTNVTISSSQIKKVNCPVCNAEVPEASINNHLDSCLSF